MSKRDYESCEGDFVPNLEDFRRGDLERAFLLEDACVLRNLDAAIERFEEEECQSDCYSWNSKKYYFSAYPAQGGYTFVHFSCFDWKTGNRDVFHDFSFAFFMDGNVINFSPGHDDAELRAFLRAKLNNGVFDRLVEEDARGVEGGIYGVLDPTRRELSFYLKAKGNENGADGDSGDDLVCPSNLSQSAFNSLPYSSRKAISDAEKSRIKKTE